MNKYRTAKPEPGPGIGLLSALLSILTISTFLYSVQYLSPITGTMSTELLTHSVHVWTLVALMSDSFHFCGLAFQHQATTSPCWAPYEKKNKTASNDHRTFALQICISIPSPSCSPTTSTAKTVRHPIS